MGNCLFLRARGWGIDRQVKKKLQISGGMPREGMVTGRIEPCIRRKSRLKVRKCRSCIMYDYTIVDLKDSSDRNEGN